MPIKTRTMFGLGLALAMGSSAWAAIPPDAGSLGALDAWASVCGKVAPAAPGAYEAYVTSAEGAQSAATLAALRASPVYKQAFLTLRDVYLNEVPRKSLKQDCLATLNQPLP